MPPVLQAHSGMCAFTTLRNESPGGSCGEGSCSDRTRHAGARGSPRCRSDPAAIFRRLPEADKDRRV